MSVLKEEEGDIGEVTHEFITFKNVDSVRSYLHSRMRENDICMDEPNGPDFTNVLIMKDGILQTHPEELEEFSNVVAQFGLFARSGLNLQLMRHNRDYGFPQWKMAFLSKSRTDELNRRKRVKPSKLGGGGDDRGEEEEEV